MSDEAIYLAYVTQVAEAFVIANQPTVTFKQLKAHFLKLFRDNELDPMKCRVRTEDDAEAAAVDAIDQLKERGVITRIKSGVYQYGGFVPIFSKLCGGPTCGSQAQSMCSKCNMPLCSDACLKRHAQCGHCQ